MVNKTILVGNLGKDPEMKQVNGTDMARFSLATTEKWTDKSGERQSKTQWHQIVCWGKLATLASNYLHKGSKVYLEGGIDYISWDKPDGSKAYKTEIKASIIQFLDSKKDSQSNDGDSLPDGF